MTKSSNPQSPFQIFIRSPNPETRTLSLTLPFPNPNHLTLHHLKSTLIPSHSPLSLSSFFFSLNGKPIPDSTLLFPNPQITPLSTLTLHARLSGGGGDGGATGAESRDCYLNMYAVKKPDKVDPNEMRLSKWLNCSLSNEPLKPPVVVDRLGNLFNKEALVEALLKKTLPREFAYIKGLKDMIAVELDEAKEREIGGEVKFQCPVTGLEFNGKYKFYAIRSCGHVLSAKGLKEVKSSSCLVCHREFEEEDKLVINGSEEEVKVLWEKLMEEKAAKGKKTTKKGKNGGEVVVGERASGAKRVVEGGNQGGRSNGKKFKAADLAPANATKAVYASIFTSSSKNLDFKETFTCRSLPLGRN